MYSKREGKRLKNVDLLFCDEKQQAFDIFTLYYIIKYNYYNYF